MHSIMTDLKRFLQLWSTEAQLYEMNYMVIYISKSNNKVKNVNRRFCILKKLGTLKNKIILNHKEHLNYE